MSARLQYIYLLRPTRRDMLITGPTSRESEVIARHFAYLRAATLEGVCVLAGRTLRDDESTFGVCVFQAESSEQAQGFMESDPAVSDGVMTAELHPFRIALWRGPDTEGAA